MSSFQNTTFLLTGAGSGMGRELAIQAAQQGANVVATDMNEASLAETVKLCHPHKVWHSASLDVSDAEAIQRFALELLPKLDAAKPLVLINNAGVGLGSGPFMETDLADFEWLLNINLWGVVRMTKAFLPFMIEHNRGQVVNISSVFGLAGVENQSAYCTSKFGVRGFSDVLRMELYDTNVSVTCVHPGGIKTNIAAASRIGKGGFVTEAMHQQGAASFAAAARTTPQRAAEIILDGIARRKARVLIGSDAHQIEWITRLFPIRYVGMLRRQIQKAFKYD